MLSEEAILCRRHSGWVQAQCGSCSLSHWARTPTAKQSVRLIRIPYNTRPIRCHEVEMPSRAVSYSPDGSKITVGFGTPVRESSKQFDGKWIVLQEDDFQVCLDGFSSTILAHIRSLSFINICSGDRVSFLRLRFLMMPP